MENIALKEPAHTVRKSAVNKIDDEDILVHIARHDTNHGVRQLAWEKIKKNNPNLILTAEEVRIIFDEEKLIEIAKYGLTWQSRVVAVQKITNENVLADIAKNDEDYRVRQEAVKGISDEMVLISIVENETYKEVLKEAVRNPDLKDKDVLASYAKSHKNWNVRLAAVGNENISQDVVYEVAKTDKTWYVRNEAVSYINDELRLKEIAKTDFHSWIRVNAIKHIEDKVFILGVIESDDNRFVRESAKVRLKKLL